MVATLHPPPAGLAPQYSLPLGLGTGVGRPTLLEHTATVLVKQRWHTRRKTCTLPLPLTMSSLSCPALLFLLFFVLFASVPLPLCHALYGAHLCFTHRISASFLFTCGFVTFHNYGRLMQIFIGKANVFVCVLASHFILLLYFINPLHSAKLTKFTLRFYSCSPHTIHTVSFPSLSP